MTRRCFECGDRTESGIEVDRLFYCDGCYDPRVHRPLIEQIFEEAQELRGYDGGPDPAADWWENEISRHRSEH